MVNQIFTKEELEDIWQNKPYGYFHQQLKSIKGKKRYKIKITAYKTEKIELGSLETIVLAKDASDATGSVNVNAAKSSLMLKLNLGKWDPTTTIQYTYQVVP
jgi:alpha-mannosidase